MKYAIWTPIAVFCVTLQSEGCEWTISWLKYRDHHGNSTFEKVLDIYNYLQELDPDIMVLDHYNQDDCLIDGKTPKEWADKTIDSYDLGIRQ
jgi:hypothetical protein